MSPLTKHTILFLAANPPGTDPLALDEEARVIQVELERCGHRDRFEFVTRWAVRPLDVLREIRKLKPTIVHFSGHGGRVSVGEPRIDTGLHRDVVGEANPLDGISREGLFLVGHDGRPQLVSIATLEETFGAVTPSIQLVVLNACYSEMQADALLRHVGCVVGVDGAFSDDAARSFAIGFYGGLGERQSIAAAFRQGRAAVSLEGLLGDEKPQLKVRVGIDAEQHIIANTSPPRSASLRDLLLSDLASWGDRHVFGNLPRKEWDNTRGIPFLPLDELYVQPDGAVLRDDEDRPNEPLLMLIERLTAVDAKKPQVVVVLANFGMGKSLNARMLACRWARQRLTSRTESLNIPWPIYLRCASDFPRGRSDAVDLLDAVRRALKRHAEAMGHSAALDDESFSWPAPEERAVFLLDGLDEIVLSQQQLHILFQNLQDKTTREHRFVVFSRPGTLPPAKDLGADVAMVNVQLFNASHIENWLENWNKLQPNGRMITLEIMKRPELSVIAQTPILLFMLAFAWNEEMASKSTAEIFEHFFHQVARGKTPEDRDVHRPIADASDKLRLMLRKAGVLAPSAGQHDAMLWLMGRVAWEAHILDQRQPSESLTRQHVEDVLRNENELSAPDKAIDGILDGLVLTLQVGALGADDKILFGHKSFREFLVGRHWAMTLRRIINSDNGEAVTASLLGGRLLGHEDKSFYYLVDFVNSNENLHGDSLLKSPLGWNDEERTRLVLWAQKTFDDERLEYRRSVSILRNDRRAVLREAALAIGSLTSGNHVIRASKALRSMLAWFWVTGKAPIVVALGADLRQTELRGANFGIALLGGADLSGSDLRSTDFEMADFQRANLSGVDFRGANLSTAVLGEANLTGAKLTGANLDAANLTRANMSKAKLNNVSLSSASLTKADLLEADLRGANLRGADLVRADLSRADLRGADLRGTQLLLAGLREANLCDANLCRANLGGADLRGADLRGTNLREADLSRADLREAVHDKTTLWPTDFDQ